MNPVKFDILTFFESRKANLFAKWKEHMKAPSDPFSQNSFEHQGLIFFDIIHHSFSLSGNELDDYLRKKAVEIARSQLKQDSSISLFVHNVNIAKTEIFVELLKYPIKQEEIQSVYRKFSYIINQFLFYAVSHFSLLNNKLMEEKSRYIYNTHEDRLTQLGQMTSSFVHEFRNPLTTVHGFIQLLRAEHPELPYLDIIAGELDQLKFRITQFLMLSRREILEQESSVFSLNELLDQIASFIYPRLLEVNVHLQRELEDGLYVSGLIEEIRQVVINIIFNALEVLAVQTSESVIHIKGYKENNQIILKTSNTGPKIPDDLLQSIFEPFVTTKKTGTGLGLFVSKEIIEKHQGQLICESDDVWTTFTIILPSAEKRNQD